MLQPRGLATFSSCVRRGALHSKAAPWWMCGWLPAVLTLWVRTFVGLEAHPVGDVVEGEQRCDGVHVVRLHLRVRVAVSTGCVCLRKPRGVSTADGSLTQSLQAAACWQDQRQLACTAEPHD